MIKHLSIVLLKLVRPRVSQSVHLLSQASNIPLGLVEAIFKLLHLFFCAYADFVDNLDDAEET